MNPALFSTDHYNLHIPETSFHFAHHNWREGLTFHLEQCRCIGKHLRSAKVTNESGVDDLIDFLS